MLRHKDIIPMVLGGIAAAMYLLQVLSRRYPHVAWLLPFRNVFPRLSEEQRAKIRRRSNIHAGAQLILLGLALPLCYGALTMMTFSSFDTVMVGSVLAGSVLCVGLGITAIWQNRRD